LDSRNFLRITQQRTRIEEKKKIEIELDKHFKIGVQYTDQKKKSKRENLQGVGIRGEGR
jgi:ribulose bisphosphate carboxylase small subunit